MKGSAVFQILTAAVVIGFCAAAGGVFACETVLTHAEIAAADTARAVEFFGPKMNAELGGIVNAAGDVNGDGFDDFVLVAQYENSQAGALYLVFGRSAAEWASATFNFSAADTPNASSWVRIGAVQIYSFFGYHGVAPGDYNGDELGDFLVGSQIQGRAYCVYGHTGAWSSFNTTSIENGDVPGFFVFGGSGVIRYVGNAGDMNGDGIEDLLVMNSNNGIVSVVFGEAGPTRDNFNTSSIDGTNGFLLTDGMTSLGIGGAMETPGDVNGDGLADLAIGSPNQASTAGRVYILFARNVSETGQPWPLSLNLTTELDGTNGFVVYCSITNAYLGRTVVGAGDVNADGFADIFIGSANNGLFLVFGCASWTSPFDATALDGTNGFHFMDSSENWGYSGGGAGDVNGDGIDDVIIGGYYALNSTGTLRTGAAAIIFGHSGAWAAKFDHNDIVGSVGFLIDGPAESSQFAQSARGAGDVNGDGLADVIAGAAVFSSSAGYAALVFGFDDHCAVCSNFTDACLVCDDGFVLNGTICEAQPPAPSSSSSSSIHKQGSSSVTVVVIETGSGGGSVGEVAEEVAQLLGVDVGQISVVEITPGTFEVAVINEEVAQQLVDLITQCTEEEEA